MTGVGIIGVVIMVVGGFFEVLLPLVGGVGLFSTILKS